MAIINLGQVGAIFLGQDQPSNIKLLWYDEGDGILKFYNKSSLNWEPLVSGSNSSVLQNELRVIGVTVGGVSNGDSWAAGTQIETVLRDILSNIKSPSYSQPTASLSISPSNTIYEVGVQISVNLIPSFNQNDSGGLASYSLVKNGIELTDAFGSYSDTFVITIGNNLRHSAVINYSEGATKYNNDVPPELDPTGKILAGSLNPYAPQIKGVLPYFYGVSDSDQISAAEIYSGSKIVQQAPNTIVLPNGFGTGDKFLWFAVPQVYSKNYLSWYKSFINNGDIGGESDLFGLKQAVNVSSSGLNSNWIDQPYDLYVSNYVTGASGRIELRT